MTCDKIMLMFGLGKYVDKAMELKLQYAPLNKYQMDLVENKDKYEAKLKAVEQEYRQGTSFVQPVENTDRRQLDREEEAEDEMVYAEETQDQDAVSKIASSSETCSSSETTSLSSPASAFSDVGSSSVTSSS